MKTLIENYEVFKQPSITCGILTFNEEDKIGKCLDSIDGLFDEIIILDSYSNDNTVNIIKSKTKNTKIIYSEWINDFSHHRNLIIDNAKSDWIYFIDSDNIYDSSNCSNAHSIAKVASFFNLNVTISPIIIEHDNSFTVDNRRLFPLNNNIYFKGKVHEEPFSGDEVLTDLIVNIKVFHYGYNPDKVNYSKKKLRNLSLTKEMLGLEPNLAKWHYFYARDLFLIDSISNIEEIEYHLIKALNLYAEHSYYKRYMGETISLLCEILLYQNKIESLLMYIELLEDTFEECIDPKYYRYILVEQNLNMKIKKLINQIEELLNIEERSFSFIDPNFNHLRNLFINICLNYNNLEYIENLYKNSNNINIKNQISNTIKAKKETLDNILERLV